MHIVAAGNAHRELVMHRFAHIFWAERPCPEQSPPCSHGKRPRPRGNRPYSARRFSTGFACAARRLRDNTVPNATSTSPSAATPKIHQDKPVR